jgi:hypothetical protein
MINNRIDHAAKGNAAGHLAAGHFASDLAVALDQAAGIVELQDPQFGHSPLA